ncbi:AI-2E family transporter [Mesorhizobium sp. L-8-10]|uniref:AI-2E family transporter n=1 Tax=Mesorhizobium sp. L-8-10 TaxID=2744523 RepID=UPI00192744F9|nr:AI-2E family transporter [Mesorhizobium sp. L-8-10]
MSLPTIAATAAVIAALYFGREVFLPLAVALLLTFALAPVVAWLRRFGIPRIAAVVASVFSAFAAVALFSFVLAVQVTELAHNITLYQSNILTKVRTLKDTGASGGIVDRLTGVIERVGREIEAEEQPAATGEAEREPLPVEIVSRQKPLDVLLSMLTPLFGPLATTGLIIVVVIFMLLEREDLRDRFIRLVGYGDLHRTTQALEDAGGRVGQYLLAQLLVNTAYAIPVAIGLWLLGIPNAPLWGLLALVLRFVPFIGPVIAMLLPLFLAVAVAPGWSLVLWTAALFIVMELVINNVVEPYVYGSRTGLSPLAIIVAAIFWTWLWGPLGLVLSTPLTVCLVVLGRHVPQFEFLDVLFGNEPVLEPHARLYQRLLAGDPDEATDHAEDFLEEGYLVDFYRTVAVPALLLGEHDRARGVMTEAERRRMASSALTMVANLEDIVREEADEEEADDEDNGLAEEAELPDGTGMTVCCAGGRGELDDAAAAMLAQVLEVQGATVSRLSFAEIEPGNIRSLDLKEVDTIVIGFLNMDSMNHARFLVRRLKRARRGLRVGIVYWSDAGTSDNKALVEMAGVINADFVAQGMLDAVTGALSDTPAVPLKLPTRARRRAPARKKAKAAAEG